MTKDLTEGKPYQVILLMSLPIMIGNFFQQLYSVVDTMIVGKFIGSNALAAVGSTSSVSALIMWFVCGLSGGYAILLAQHFGAGDTDILRKGVCASLSMSGVVTLLITFISLIFLKRFLILMNTPSEILEDAYTYIFVIIAGMLATVLYNICAAILRALGDSKTPLYFLIISSVLNIGLDIFFIRSLNMGVFGAALATVLSQAISGILCFAYMYSRFEIIRFKKADWKVDLKYDLKMLSFGLPAGLCGVFTALGILILQYAINCYGTDIIAGYTAAIKVQNFAEIPLNAFSTTMLNFAGQNIGAGKYLNAKKGYRQGIAIGLLVSAVCGFFIIFFGDVFASLFVDATEAPEVIRFASKYLIYTGALFMPYSILLNTRSTLQGMGDRISPVATGIFETLIRIGFTIYLVHNLSELTLCLVNPIIWVCTALFLITMYLLRWHKIYKENPSLKKK